MSSKTLTDLTQATTLSKSDITHIRQGLVDKKTSLDQLAQHIFTESDWGFAAEVINANTVVSSLLNQRKVYFMNTSAGSLSLTLPFDGGGASQGCEIVVSNTGSNPATVTYKAGIYVTLAPNDWAFFVFHPTGWVLDSNSVGITLSSYLQIGSAGPKIKNSGSSLLLRNNTDDAYVEAVMKALKLGDADHILEVLSDTQLQLKNAGSGLILGTRGDSIICGNCYFTGTNWMRVDITKPAMRIATDYVNGQLLFYAASAGSNPISWDLANGVIIVSLASSLATLNSRINSLDPLGVPKPYFSTVLPDYYLWCDGKTIGDALSGATARANTDVHDLFVVLWSATGLNIYESTGALSGRGATAEADWAAHKRLALPKINGRTLIGCDNLGGASADVVTNNNADILGGTGGEEKHSLNTTEIPSHTHYIASNEAPYSGGYGSSGINGGTYITKQLGTGGDYAYAFYPTGTAPSVGLIGYSGGNGPHNNMQPWVACNYIMRY